MDEFILGLERGTITHNRKPYTSETQKTIKKFVKKFYKWLLGENVIYPKLVQHIDTSGSIPEINALSKEEIDKLINRAGKLSHKFILAVLFDSGTRSGIVFI